MSILPETLEETIKAIQGEIRGVIPVGSQDKAEKEAAERLLGWLEDLNQLKTDDTAAIENTVDALRRIADGVEMNPLVTAGDKHYVNRINKLINNLEEVAELERKRKKA